MPITPDYVIELNEDYSLANHSIHTYVCRYIQNHTSFPNKPVITTQNGGGINNCSGKFFTPNALRFLGTCSITPDDILNYLSGNITNSPEQSHNFFVQSGGRYRHKRNRVHHQVPKETRPHIELSNNVEDNNTEFIENYSGDKENKRLVYLVRFAGQTVVVKIMNGDKKALKEKYLYRFFNKKSKRDEIVRKQVLRSYDTEDYVTEHINDKQSKQNIQFIIIPCEVNGVKYKVKLDNTVIPLNNKDEPFLNSKATGLKQGTYNRVNELYSQCSYLVVEVRPEFTIYKEYVNGEANPQILKEIITKTDNVLSYLNKLYGFNHWDLHYNNLLIDVHRGTPIDICLFDFDLSAGGDYTNIDAYMKRLHKYIYPNHNLFESYQHLKINPEKGANVPKEILMENKAFETFIDNPIYHDFDLESHLSKFNTPRKLENYFKYMGRMMDLMRIMDISKKKIMSVEFTEHDDISNECLVVYRLVYLCDINSHKRMSYCTLLFAEYLLSFRS
jgi:hypothetical protein